MHLQQKRRRRLGWTAAIVGLAASLEAGDFETALNQVRSVGAGGQGNAPAREAWKVLSSGSAATLPLLLKGLDGSSELAANWIRSAVDTVVARATQNKEPLPFADLGALLADSSHAPKARSLAFEVLRQTHPEGAAALLPGFLNDPAPELRREAVAALLAQAMQAKTSGKTDFAALVLQQLISSARDADQIESISKQLSEMGRKVDLTEVFGFLTQWKVIGPFDNAKGIGFNAVYEPEKGINFSAEYDGKEKKAAWREFKSADEMGKVDINKVLGNLKGATAYAYAEFNVETARPVELRLGCKNGWKVWLNEKYLFGRDEYHRGMEIDQYRIPVQLNAGANRVLVKICQDEQKEDWTVEWEFQLRFCDASGTPVRPSLLSHPKP